jgi:hypothetical protein
MLRGLTGKTTPFTKAIFLINGKLSGLENRVKEIKSAVQLFDYCTAQSSAISNPFNQFESWTFIAARDMVMSINHFMKELIAANDMAIQLPELREHLDRAAMGKARKEFDEAFPSYAKLRHAVAHAGELAKNLDAFEENAYSGPNISNLMLQNGLINRQYTYTFEGKFISCEISEASVEKITAIMNQFFSAFQSIPSPIEIPKEPDQPPHQ